MQMHNGNPNGKVKRIPKRLCVGCQELQPKTDLIRIVKKPDGEIFLDVTGKSAGRGTYLCRKLECFDKAKKGHRLERSFSCAVPEQIYEEMRHELENELAESSDNLS